MKKRIDETEGEIKYFEDDPLEKILDLIREERGDEIRSILGNEEFMMCANMFMIPLVDKSKWRPNHKMVAMSNLVTVSDEAFGLLVMENNIEDWISEITPRKEGEARHIKGSLCKYTKQVKGHDEDNNNNKKQNMNRGWDIRGRERYNRVFDKVKEQRETNVSKEKEIWMLERWRVIKDKKRKKKRNETTKEELELKERENSYVPRVGFYD